MISNTRKDVLLAIQRKTKANTKSPKAAQEALCRLGITDSKGQVTKEYSRDPRSEGMLRANER